MVNFNIRSASCQLGWLKIAYHGSGLTCPRCSMSCCLEMSCPVYCSCGVTTYIGIVIATIVRKGFSWKETFSQREGSTSYWFSSTRYGGCMEVTGNPVDVSVEWMQGSVQDGFLQVERSRR